MWLIKIILDALLFRDHPTGAQPPVNPWMLRIATLMLIIVVLVLIILGVRS